MSFPCEDLSFYFLQPQQQLFYPLCGCFAKICDCFLCFLWSLCISWLFYCFSLWSFCLCVINLCFQHITQDTLQLKYFKLVHYFLIFAVPAQFTGHDSDKTYITFFMMCSTSEVSPPGSQQKPFSLSSSPSSCHSKHNMSTTYVENNRLSCAAIKRAQIPKYCRGRAAGCLVGGAL